MRDKFIERLTLLAGGNPNILLVTGDLGFGVFDKFRKDLPDQFINAGIAEQNMTGLAVGLAIEGKIVFTYSIANFSTLRCLEQIRNDACYHEANVKVVSVGGGFSYGALGISHHATEDITIMRSLPNLSVVSPCGLWEAAEAASALVKQPGTCYLRLDKSYGNDNPYPNEKYLLGKARILSDGGDCTVIVTGGILGEVQQAAKIMEKQGISLTVLSMHTIVPFDKEAVLHAAYKTGGIVTVEENTIHGGLGGAVSETLMDAGVFPGFFLRIGLEAGFSSVVGSQKYLRKIYGMDAWHIAERIMKKLNE
ncbi:MAG: transketolase [Desulfobacterium sp.]|nr:transketolase [Desulfobacterium sp.]